MSKHTPAAQQERPRLSNIDYARPADWRVFEATLLDDRTTAVDPQENNYPLYHESPRLLCCACK